MVGLVNLSKNEDKGFYVFRFRPNNSTPTFEISRYDASTNELVKLVTGDGTGWTASTWYQLRLGVQGNTLTAFVDGKAFAGVEPSPGKGDHRREQARKAKSADNERQQVQRPQFAYPA